MKVIYKYILLLIIFWPVILNAQTRVVKGTVKDPVDGSPMPGAYVIVKGTNNSVVTDLNGNYSIVAPIGSTLEIAFIGYKTQEIYVGPEEEDISDKTQPKAKLFKHKIPDNPEKTISPYFFVQSDNPEVDRMPLKATSAEVNISGVIADVKIKQVYVNEGKNTLEAIYIFPGSTRAAVYGMNMTIGDRILFAKIKEKEQARVEYEQAKQEGKTASLLEQHRPNVFQMNVANILPGDSISVEISYTELLEYNQGIYEFIYPTVVGPRYSNAADNEENKDEQWISNPYLPEKQLPNYTFKLNTSLNAGMPIKEINSSSHKINIKYTGQNSAKINLDPTEAQGGNRDFVLRYRLTGNKVESGILLYKHNDENFFTLMMQPPKNTTPELIPPREYVFIVDVSGSMHGYPLEVSKTMMKNLLSHMRYYDKFNILLFSGGSELYSTESVEASEDNINKAIMFIERQQGGGGTEILPAFERAFSLPYKEGYARIFVALTDGYVGIEKKLFNYISNHLNEANCFAVGIGNGVNRYLIEGIAAAGMGQSYVIQNVNEAEKTGKKFMDFVENPVYTHIELAFNKLDAYDIQPEHVPDVFSERPIIVTGKFKGEAKGSITVSGYAGNQLYSMNYKIDSAVSDNNPALRYLWARNKIKYLDDYAKFYSGSDNYWQQTNDEIISNKKEATALGLKYNLLTQYTSFIAVDSIIRNKKHELVKVKQPLPLPQGVSNLAVGGRGDVTLLEAKVDLNDVVIRGNKVQNDGFTKVRDLGTAVTRMELKDMKSANSTTVEEMLQGRMGGVDISSVSGDPGAGLNVRIRGTSSLNAKNSPLIVVNGIPYAAEFENFDFANANVQKLGNLINVSPEDIESIEVLKDAATISIYGAAAANGVLKIKTKAKKAGIINAQKSKTFKIEDLKRPDKLTYQNSKNQIFQNLIISDDFPYNIVASSNLPDSLVNFGFNSFFYGMYQAYADHRPFVLSPDMIWLLISQGFSRHVNLNAEELRKYFVDFTGKIDLIVRNDDIKLNDPKSPWELVFPEFTNQIGKHTGKELIDALSSNFTTTTSVEKVASEITIMEAMKPYFDFVVIRMVCGIPEITLEGTTEDWQKVLKKAQYLRKYKLDWWIDEIEPVLKKFEKASKGEVDTAFWKNMFKIHSKETCGTPEIIDGWIVKFFPYDKKGNRNSLEEIKGKDNLPQEIVKVDMKFVELINGQTINTPLELWAGFFGLEQDKSTFSLKPKIGWLIRKKNVSNDAVKLKFESENNFEYGIKIRVKEIPEQLLKIPEIYILDVQFENEIKIPEELKNVRIGKLKLSGRISDSAAVRISKLFPKTQLIINEKVYKNSESSDWIVVYDSIPQNVLKKEHIWILQVWNQSKFSMPDNIKNVKIDKLQFINKLDEEEIKRIKELLPNTELYIGNEKK